MKYGKIDSHIPIINGTILFCFFPYIKNPKPIDPKSIPQISTEALSIVIPARLKLSATHTAAHQRRSVALCKAVVDNYFIEVQLPRPRTRRIQAFVN
jgi:hypothetical protein